MRKMMIAMALSLTAISAPVGAELKDYAKAGNWDIYTDDHDCTMSAEFQSTSTLAIDYDARSGLSTVRFTVPQTKSLDTGDTRQVMTVFSNGTASSIDTGWGTKTFIAIKANEETLLTHIFDDQFLIDLVKYKTLAFFYNERILTSYNLADSTRAIQLLRQCAEARSRENPSDPFKFDKA